MLKLNYLALSCSSIGVFIIQEVKIVFKNQIKPVKITIKNMCENCGKLSQNILGSKLVTIFSNKIQRIYELKLYEFMHYVL